MTKYLDLELPTTTKPSERIEWSGERFADLAEGIIGVDVGWFIWGIIVGWSDLGTADEKRQYLALAANYEQLIRSMT